MLETGNRTMNQEQERLQVTKPGDVFMAIQDQNLAQENVCMAGIRTGPCAKLAEPQKAMHKP